MRLTSILLGSFDAKAQSNYWQFGGYADVLYNQCTSSQISERNRCYSYITAAADGFNMEDHEHFKCVWAFIDPEVNPDQLAAAVIKYMNNTAPSSMKIPAIVAVRNAMMAFYSCPR